MDIALVAAVAAGTSLVDAFGSRPGGAAGWDLLLAAPLVLRRRWPACAAALIAAVCLAQWLAGVQPLLRHGFAMILSAQADIEVIGEAADGAEAVRLTGLLRPDVVLMDVRMPGMDGIEATRKITLVSPPTRVIILTTFDVDEYAFDGLRAGASGFLLKNARPDELLSGIRSVATGDAVLAPSTTRRVLDAFAGASCHGRLWKPPGPTCLAR